MTLGSTTRTKTSRIGMLVAVVAVVGLAAMTGSVAADSSVDESSVAIDGNLTVTVDSSDTSLSSGDDFTVVVDDGSQTIGGSTVMTFDGAGSYTANISGIDPSYVGTEQTVVVRNVNTGSQDPIGFVNLTRANTPDIVVAHDDAIVSSAPEPFGGEKGNVTVDLSGTVLDEGDISVKIDGVGYSDIDDSSDSYTVSLNPEDIGDTAGDSLDYTVTNDLDNQQVETGQLALIDPAVESTGNISELNGNDRLNVSVDVSELDDSDTYVTNRTGYDDYTITLGLIDETGSVEEYPSPLINVSKETNGTVTAEIFYQDPNTDEASLTVPSAVESISVDGSTVYESDDDGAMLIGATDTEGIGSWIIIGALVVAFVVFRD